VVTRARPWTTTELQALRALATYGATHIARTLDRTIASVKAAAHRYRISLRPTTEHRGKLLDEPRASSLNATGQRHIRVAILAGDINPHRLQAHLDHEAATLRGERHDLCPACTARPIERRTGLCTVCHTRALTEAYRHATTERTAERELVTERQRRHRNKRN
jgi:formate dehydrogenase maturation protein FdhE